MYNEINMKISKLLVGVASFALIGAGCLGGGSSAGPDGGPWATVDGGANWTGLHSLPSASGVGSINGVNVTSIEIDPTDTSAYYMGTEANGLLYSYDSGASWMRPEDGEARTGAVLGAEVDPRDVCTIYVLKTQRILKSTDCARTFTSMYVETRTDETLTSFVLDWYNPDILWVGSSSGDVIRSLDAGSSWTTVTRLKSDIMAVAVGNNDSRVILVGTKSSGLFRSSDSGATWVEYKDQLKDFKSSSNVYGFTQTDDGTTLVMNTKYGLLVSKDSGFTWASLSLISGSGDVRAWSVTVDPKDDSVMYYGTEGVFYQSDNGGQSWQTTDFPSARAPKAMVVDSENRSRVIVGFASIEK